MSTVYILAGLVLLVLGGDTLVRGSVAVARRFGVSPLLIGIALVGFGTSMPEMLISVQAAMEGFPGIAVGNVVGSNISNILLIVGVAGLVMPLRAEPRAFYRDGTVLAIATLLCLAVVLAGWLDRLAGAVFVACLIAYIVFTYLKERRSPDESAQLHSDEAAARGKKEMPLWLASAMALGGLAITMVGARLMVFGAVDLARTLGVSDTIIGLTVVAIGTSAPELVTAIMAGIRKQPDVAFGNVIGSNIYNILGILGVTAVVQPIPVPTEIMGFDIWVMVGATALLIASTITGWRISRKESALFLLLYVSYLGYLTMEAKAGMVP